MTPKPAPGISSETKLLRAVRLPDIVALTINGIIGAGIFALPASTAAILGTSSPVAFLIAGIFMMIIVLCFAELGARYDKTGGAYLYAWDAFGGPVAFLIGWMYFLARITSVAALSNALMGFVSYFFPLPSPFREIVVLFVLAILGWINYSGIRFSSGLINFLTAGKLIPLSIFIVAGLIFMRWDTVSQISLPQIQPLSKALLLVMFAFSGFEVIAVPGAEMVNPKRDLPLGLLIGSGITVVFYLLIQIVAVAFLPELAASKAPLAEAAQNFLGKTGGSILSAGAICSTIGTLTSLLLVGPRILYAMALNHQMPTVFSKVHKEHLTPHVAIGFFTLIVMLITLQSSFTILATLSAIARLLTYVGSACALLALRKKRVVHEGFRIPGGPAIPLLTIAVSILLLTAVTKIQWITGLIALTIGALLYLIAARQKQRT